VTVILFCGGLGVVRTQYGAIKSRMQSITIACHILDYD